jgi:hypothetical protein
MFSWPFVQTPGMGYEVLGPGCTGDWLPADNFVLRARAMVLTGERTLSGARQFCPRARHTAAYNYVYRLSRALKNRLQRTPRHRLKRIITSLPRYASC